MATDTYTSPYGNTPQGTQLQSGQDILSAIKGIVGGDSGAGQALTNAVGMQGNQGQYAQETKQAVYSQPGIQQPLGAYNNMSDLYKMFIADQQLAQKYTRPDFQSVNTPTVQPSDVPTFGAIGAPQMAAMTPQSVTQPFSGFTDPSLAFDAAESQGKGIMGVLNNIGSLLTFNSGQGANEINDRIQAYKDAIQQNLDLANLYVNLQTALGGGTSTKDREAALLNDLRSGKTLEDAMADYPDLPANTVYNYYNRINNDPLRKKNYGPAKQLSSDLYTKYGVTTATATGKVPVGKLSSQQTSDLNDAKQIIKDGGYTDDSGNFIPYTREDLIKDNPWIADYI